MPRQNSAGLRWPAWLASRLWNRDGSMRLPVPRARKRSLKSAVLSDEVVALLAARVAHRWGAPPWSRDRFLDDNPIGLLRLSESPAGVACAFVDLPYLRSFGADLIGSFAAAHRGSPVGLHLHLYRTTPAEIEAMVASSALAEATWLGLSYDNEAAPAYAGRRNLAHYYITARFILVDRLLARYRRPLAMIDADVEVRRDFASFFEAMRGCDVGLIVRDDDKPAWRRLLAAATFFNCTEPARRFAAHLADSVAADIHGDLPFSLDALYLHFCHQAARARGDVRFGSIPNGMSDHEFSPGSWIWHRKGDRKRERKTPSTAART